MALFVSDVHLGDHDPDTADAFFSALDAHAPAATHLFVLGDLFDAWIGDDWADTVSGRLLGRLAALSAAGTRVLVMRGNRDFLLDVPGAATGDGAQAAAPSFSARCGATMLDDPCVVELFGRRVLLAHGDALCTDDVDYLTFRAQARSAAWQHAFLAQPVERRVATARAMRAQSEASKGGKADYLMDVNLAAVGDAMRAADVTCLIHGHTHRPAEHRFRLDGLDATRWVLPDWDAGASHTGASHASTPASTRRGGFLRVDARGWQRLGDWPDPAAPSG
ncbi:MAG TPA: UDP-2,3-diacylglucosamine diphosphatase [Quisquiliibacterium sp.]|nr:UDP-2,3-diacylglucosamine diphosphatase [Quisquiliibacterium sp.]HQD81890.1 UDP-2,3-diacylglucosamine diphosphatase [Quisquiliibacterium sp.]HQN13001.1 UDP-2,3-diacylglucosamine diphosphatase [Quisquiliibacterium sp.]